MSKVSVTRNVARALSFVALVGSLSLGAYARDAKSKVTPTFPELAKKMNVSGAVKVEVVVAPNGVVKSAKAIGGHPLLIDAAVNAAKGFKYEPAADESKEIIEFKFGSAQ